MSHIPNTGVMSAAFPLHQWSDSFRWEQLVEVVDRRLGRSSQAATTRVFLVLTLLRHELQCSHEEICELLRTDTDVMHACGLNSVETEAFGPYRVCSDQLSEFENHLDDDILRELVMVHGLALAQELN